MYKFDDAIPILIEKFPYMRNIYEEKEWLYKRSQFMFFGIEFFAYIVDIANQNNHEELQRVCHFLEDMLTNGDEITQNLIEVGVIESVFLQDDKFNLEDLKKNFGELTMKSYEACFE